MALSRGYGSRENSTSTGSIADTIYGQPSHANRAARRPPPAGIIEGNGRDSNRAANPCRSLQVRPKDPQLAISRYYGSPRRSPPPQYEDYPVMERDPHMSQRSSTNSRHYLWDEDPEGSWCSDIEFVDDDRYSSAPTAMRRPRHSNYRPGRQYARSFEPDCFADDGSEESFDSVEMIYKRMYISPAAVALPPFNESRSYPAPEPGTCVERIQVIRRSPRRREEDDKLSGRSSRDYNGMTSREYLDRISTPYDHRRSRQSPHRSFREHDEKSFREYPGRRSRDYHDNISKEYRPRELYTRDPSEHHERRHERSRRGDEEYRYH